MAVALFCFANRFSKCSRTGTYTRNRKNIKNMLLLVLFFFACFKAFKKKQNHKASWNKITKAVHDVPQVGLLCGSATPRSACRLFSGVVSIPPREFVIEHVSVLFLLFFFWFPCMMIIVSIRYNGGLLPDIILLTRCYLHRGTRLNAMKRFCTCSL